MDKLNGGLFNSSITIFDSMDFEIQSKLFVNVPKQRKVKGKFIFQLLYLYEISIYML